MAKNSKCFVLFLFLLFPSVSAAAADECKFNYWEIVPQGNACAIYHLPDFNFRSVPEPPDAPEHIKRFCQQYEVSTSESKQTVGYCYTGEGDPSGPPFEVKGRKYFADLNFVGCLDGVKREGIVFVSGDWRKAPKNLRRLWPLEDLPKKASCEP